MDFLTREWVVVGCFGFDFLEAMRFSPSAASLAKEQVPVHLCDVLVLVYCSGTSLDRVIS